MRGRVPQWLRARWGDSPRRPTATRVAGARRHGGRVPGLPGRGHRPFAPLPPGRWRCGRGSRWLCWTNRSCGGRCIWGGQSPAAVGLAPSKHVQRLAVDADAGVIAWSDVVLGEELGRVPVKQLRELPEGSEEELEAFQNEIQQLHKLRLLRCGCERGRVGATTALRGHRAAAQRHFASAARLGPWRCRGRSARRLRTTRCGAWRTCTSRGFIRDM